MTKLLTEESTPHPFASTNEDDVDPNFYRPVVDAAKRLGLQHCHTMGDWFVGWNPRSESGSAEGHWVHWVNLAAYILSHPATKAVAPKQYQPQLVFDRKMYNGGKELSSDKLTKFFGE